MAEGNLAVEVRKKKKVGSLKWLQIKEQITGYLYVLPAFLIVFLFGLFPIGYSFYMSLFNWQVTKGNFVGADNYLRIFGDWRSLIILAVGLLVVILAFTLWGKAPEKTEKGKITLRIISGVIVILGIWLFGIAWRLMSKGGQLLEPGLLFKNGYGPILEPGNADFLKSLIVTLYYALGTVPAEIITGMVIAYILYQGIKGKEIFRMIFFLPYVTPAVTTAVVFQIIFSNRPTSIANTLVGLFGLDPLRWRFEAKPITTLLGMNIEGFFAGPSLALMTIVLFGVWTFIGYNTVIFLAGLGNVPKEIYEAAEIDGATKMDMFRSITVPLLSPVTFYLTLVAFIGTFKAFNHIYVMRTPSAQDSVITTSLLIFDRFYKANQYSIATSQAIVLFLVILGLTFAQNKLLGEKVFYG